MKYELFKQKFEKMVRLKQALVKPEVIPDFYEEMKGLDDDDIIFAMATLARNDERLSLGKLIELAGIRKNERQALQEQKDRQTLERAEMPQDCREALDRLFGKYK